HEQELLHAHDLADRALGAEQLTSHRLPDEGDALEIVHLLAREERSLGELPPLDVEVLGRNAAPARVPVATAVGDLRAAIDVLRDCFAPWALAPNGCGVGWEQTGRSVTALSPSGDVARARLDPHQVVTELGELRFRASGAGLANGDDPYYCSHADHDA